MNLASNVFEQPWMILILLVLFFGIIVLGIILIKKFVINKNEKKVELDKDKIREDELKRILEPITDEDSLKAMEDVENKK